MGSVFYTDPQAKVTRYHENLFTNGIVLSADEKHPFVTNGRALVEFDVQKDGSFTNQREFAPRGVISATFSGPDRKTLYAVARDTVQNKDWIIAIPMMAQGPKGRGK